MRYLLFLAIFATAFALPTHIHAALLGYRFHDLGTLGGHASHAVAINNLGQIVGRSTTENGEEHTFLWHDGVMTDLGVFGGISSTAYDINDHGVIAGSFVTAGGRTHGFLWSSGQLTDLETLGGESSVAYALDNDGRAVGMSTIASGKERAFLWQGNQMSELETGADPPGTIYPASSAYALNENGMIGGDWNAAANSGGFKPALWVDGTLTVLHYLPGAVTSINGNGTAVGYAGYTSHAFTWDGGIMRDLGTFGGTSSRANSINDSGYVVGDYWTAAGSSAFVWVEDEWTTIGVGAGANDINDSGWVVGFSLDAFGNSRAALWIPVPEISGARVLAGMLIALALVRSVSLWRRLHLPLQAQR